jgi:ketosteroid isomerase-like protein
MPPSCFKDKSHNLATKWKTTMTNPTDFATQWIADWNAHDVDKILAHYAPDVVFHSPKVALFTKGAQTHFTSLQQLRPYGDQT